MDKSVLFLSNTLKVKLGYDVSTGSSRNQSLLFFLINYFFNQVLSKMQSPIKSRGPLMGTK